MKCFNQLDSKSVKIQIGKRKVKKCLCKMECFFLPLYKFYSMLAKLTRKYAAHTHRMLYYTSLITQNKDWYDHTIDLYTWMTESEYPKESHWMERCIYNLMAIKNFKEPVLLELCCGNGFNTKYFYSSSCKSIYACDFDESAIIYAKRYNRCFNICYQLCDIKESIPHKDRGGKYFTNIVWDASLIYFDNYELKKILQEIKLVLSLSNGILSGMVAAGTHKGETIKSTFKNKHEIYKLLSYNFENVNVWEIDYKSRKNIYFMASDGILPFENKENFLM